MEGSPGLIGRDGRDETYPRAGEFLGQKLHGAGPVSESTLCFRRVNGMTIVNRGKHHLKTGGCHLS